MIELPWQIDHFVAIGLENSLGKIFHLDNLMPHLDKEDYCICIGVDGHFVRESPSLRARFGDSLGLQCIEPRGGLGDMNAIRRELITILAYDGVREARQRNPDGELVILEMGSGTGMLSIAALLADPNSRVYAVEHDPNSVQMMRYMLEQYGLSDRARILDCNYQSLDERLIPEKAHVVISENMNSLFKEGQLESMKIAGRFASENAVYVPGGFGVYLRLGDDLCYLGPITPEMPDDDNLVFRLDLTEETSRSSNLDSQLVLSLLNYDGDPVYKNPGSMLSGLRLTEIISPRVEYTPERAELELRIPISGDHESVYDIRKQLLTIRVPEPDSSKIAV